MPKHTLGDMPRHSKLTIVALAAGIFFAPPLPAQQPDTLPRAPASPRPRAHPWRAIGQTFLVNAVVNRFDAWPASQWWAKIGWTSWKSNIRLGWEWDENDFATNMFLHPYHGGMYFNAGRANGLDFWESAPLAFLGSWVWEYLGERHRPALNDFFMTSFGGIALGEVFHRTSASIRSNQARGRARLGRELASLPFDPVGGLNRLFRREWKRFGPNPPEHDPGNWVLQVHTGVTAFGDSVGQPTNESHLAPTLVAELQYGDLFETEARVPYDQFTIRAQISPGAGGLNLLRASGRLFGRVLDDSSGNWHQLAIHQRYDWVSNPTQHFGGQSVEGGIRSRWKLGKGYTLESEAFADLMLMGAMDAPFAGIGERTYDFGPGAGVRLDFTLKRHGVTYLALTGRTEYLHTVSGAQADHLASFGGTELTIPIHRGIGVGLYTGYFHRQSRYSDKPDDLRELPETRLFITWTAALRPMVLVR